MGFRINTNVASLQAQTSLTKVNKESQDSLSKLSSGSRITKAADDAAGLGISEKLKAEIRSSQQAMCARRSRRSRCPIRASCKSDRPCAAL